MDRQIKPERLCIPAQGRQVARVTRDKVVGRRLTESRTLLCCQAWRQGRRDLPPEGVKFAVALRQARQAPQCHARLEAAESCIRRTHAIMQAAVELFETAGLFLTEHQACRQPIGRTAYRQFLDRLHQRLARRRPECALPLIESRGDFRQQVRARGRQQPAAEGRDRFRHFQTEQRGRTEATCGSPTDARAERMSAILDQRQPARRGHRGDPCDIAGCAEHMQGHHDASARRNRPRHALRRHGESIDVDIGSYRTQAANLHPDHQFAQRVGRHHQFVTRHQTQPVENQVERIAPAGSGAHAVAVEGCGCGILKLAHRRTRRGRAVAQATQQVGEVRAIDVDAPSWNHRSTSTEI